MGWVGYRIIKGSMADARTAKDQAIRANAAMQALDAPLQRLSVKVQDLLTKHLQDQERMEETIINAQMNEDLLRSALNREERVEAYLRMILTKYGVEQEEIEEVVSGIYH